MKKYFSTLFFVLIGTMPVSFYAKGEPLKCAETMKQYSDINTPDIAKECAQEIISKYKGPALIRYLEEHAQTGHSHVGSIHQCSKRSHHPERGSYFSEDARRPQAWSNATITSCTQGGTRVQGAWRCLVSGAPQGCTQGDTVTTAMELLRGEENAGQLITFYPIEKQAFRLDTDE